MSGYADPRALFTLMAARGRASFIARHDSTWRYDQLLRTVEGCCGLFDRQGLEPGDRVMILTADEEMAVAFFVSALLDGLVPVMLTPDTPEARAAALADRTSPGLIVVDGGRLAEAWARSALPVEAPVRRGLGLLRARESGVRAMVSAPGRAPRLPAADDQPAYILFTSGTTSAPKGVVISRRNLFSHLATLSRLFGYGQDSRIFNGMVLAHGDGLVQGPLLALANGCALIRPGPFSATAIEGWLNSVRALRATHVITVPTVFALIDRLAQHDDYFDSPECTHLVSVAAKLDEALWRRLEKRFGRPVFNQYGLTETVASGLYAGPHPEMGPRGTIGRPVDMRTRVVSKVGGDVPAGEPGELWLCGSNVFTGYWQDREQSEMVLTPDGWLRTGDLVRERPDGSFEFLGRIKTAIMCGGFLIRPEELDEALLAHPAVREAATLGVPDPDFGEVPVSAVVLDGETDEAALTAHCRERLEALKVPKRIVAVEAIPRGVSGKPRVDELRALLADEPSVAGDEFRKAVLELAANTFRIDASGLTPEATPEDVQGWDSFGHINLVLRAERTFGVQIPTAEIAAIRTLGDLAGAIERAR